MASVIATVVEGVKELLRTESEANVFMFRFEPKRVYSLDLPLVGDDLHVHVKHAANEIAVETEDRAAIRYSIPVLIAVRKHLSQSEQDQDGLPANDDLDLLVEFTEQLCEYFAQTRLVADTRAYSIEPAAIRSIGPQDDLRENRQFVGIVAVPFQCVKD